MYFIQPCFVCRPSDSTVSEDADIEPRTIATSAFMILSDSLTTQLDLIHTKNKAVKYHINVYEAVNKFA